MKLLKRIKLQAVTALCLLLFCSAAHAAVAMPKFSLVSASRDQVVESDTFAGKALFIEFFATW